jgi:hypothetical protein
VKWITENNRPANIVNDAELVKLITAGCPHMSIPSHFTISHDIQTVFANSRERIKKILVNHPGRLHFATDAWTLPNHRPFIAWTVHLEHQGQMLCFLLDVVEVPTSHTGKTMADAFQKMIVEFGLQNKILSLTADNVSANDTQTTEFAAQDNSFQEEVRVQCFNHTMQLSAKTLLRPFHPKLRTSNEDAATDVGEEVEEVEVEDDEEEEAEEGDEENDNGDEDVDDGVDEFEQLDADKREDLIDETLPVRDVVYKIRHLGFAIIRSNTILLPAWYRICK